MHIVVVAILVALMKDTGLSVVGKIEVEVVLGKGRRSGVVAVCEVVNVHEVRTSKEVGKNLVILGLVELAVKAASHGDGLGGPVLEVEGKVKVTLVYAALFLHVFASAAFAELVHLIDTVPVHVHE